jgi:long-chain acyl-CoA synthetase
MSRPVRTLADLARLHATHRSDHPALLCEDRTVSYAELYRVSKQVAHGLRAQGLRPGDRVVHLGKDSECYYELLFGAAQCGAVLVPVNWRLTAPEIEHVLTDSGAALLFADTDAEPVANELAARLDQDLTVVPLDRDGVPGAGFADWTLARPDTQVLHRVGPDDPVVQMYTSGTTGRPKGVVLAHRSFFAVREALADGGLDWLDWQPEDRGLVGVPGFHVAGIWCTIQGLIAGATNVLMRAFHPADAAALIRRHEVTIASVAPSMLRQVIALPDLERGGLPSLRKVVYGGSPISESLLTSGIDVLDCQFAQLYGLTETGNTALCLPPADHRAGGPRLRAAGRPYPGFGVRIVDRDDAELAPGEVGEVLLRTPAAMLEYWNRPDATSDTLVDGWVHTGDAGFLDDDGYLFIHDRIKDMIIVDGENVYPVEIENALTAHPWVSDAAAVGVPDRRWGEAVHAFVVAAEGQQVTPADLAGFLRGRLAPFKVPLRYEFVTALPRNPSGKILRRELRERFWQGQDRAVS